MKKPIVILLGLVAFASSCNMLTQKEAIEMNDTLVNINNNLYNKGKIWGTLFVDAVKTRDFSRLAGVRLDFEHYIDSTKVAVIHMKDVGGSEAFRNFEIELLAFEKKLVERNLKPFEAFNAQTEMTEISAMYEKLEKDSEPEKGKMDKFKTLQAEFAKKNMIKLKAEQAVDSTSNN